MTSSSRRAIRLRRVRRSASAARRQSSEQYRRGRPAVGAVCGSVPHQGHTVGAGCCSGSKTLLGPFVGLTRGILPAWGPVNPCRPRALERSGPPGSPRGRAPRPGCRPCSPASRPGDGARRGHVRSRGRASEGSGYTRRGSGGAGRGNPRGCWAASSRCPGAPASPRTLSAALEVRGPRPRAPRVVVCCAAGGNRAADRSQRPGSAILSTGDRLPGGVTG